MALWSQLDKGAETYGRTGLQRVRKPELNQEWMMKREICVLVLRPFVTGRSQFGFDSK